MSEWKTYKLGDLGTLARGKSKHRPRDASFLYGGKYPFIQTGDIKAANHKISTHTQTLSDEGLKQSKLWDKGTICITIAANIADTAILDYPACFPDSVIGFVPNKEVCDVDFMEYQLQFAKRNLQSHSIGSVQDNINLGTFLNFTVDIPDLQTQTQIAQILTSLDNKIELNIQMNQTLEAMAQALFKEWFVNFNFPKFNGELENGLPRGWRMGSLSEIMYVQNGYAFKSNDFIDEGENGILKIKNISNKVVDIVNMQFIPSEVAMNIDKRFKVESGDLLIAMTGAEVGKVGMVPNTEKNLWLNQRVGSFKEKVKYSKWFCYLILSTIEYQNILLSSASGSAQPNISGSQIERTEIILPSVDLIEEFGSIVNSLFEKILENYSFNQSLTQTRDTLLPKLMSGKLELV